MITRPASSRLLKGRYLLTPKAKTGDGQGGNTIAFNSADEVPTRGTVRYIDTEEFVDILANEVGDRAIYVTWLKVDTEPEQESLVQDLFDDKVFEIKRTAFQNGLARVVMVENV